MKLNEVIVLKNNKLKKFIENAYKGGYKNPIGAGVIFGVNDDELDVEAMIKLELSEFSGMVHISELIVLEGNTGMGFGEHILQKVTQLADKEDVVLHLIAKPIAVTGQKNIPKSKLKSFYKKQGFSVERGDVMIRLPK